LSRLEADREHKALLEDAGRGLGCMGEFDGVPNWYGGRIQHRAQIVQENGTFGLRLCQPEMDGTSRMMYRLLGSRRFIQVGLKEFDDSPLEGESKDERLERLKKWLRHPFVLLGRVYKFFYKKENVIFLYETDENYERKCSTKQGDYKRKSLENIIQWYLSPDRPKNSKLVTLPSLSHRTRY
jgi:RNA-dependent RNA polymerase